MQVGTTTAAVLEFFATEPLEADEALCDVMEQIGVQLGRVLEREQAHERLSHHALHDPLTGLPNRTLLLDRVELALAQRGHRRLAVLFVDLDRFKMVNDSLGHHVGDKLLCQFALRLRALLRPGDTVARLGGDEFVVLAESVTNEQDAQGLAERIAGTLTSPFDVDGQEVYVTASIGISMSGNEGDTSHALLRDADAAMYRAKDDGRARYELFDEALRAGVVRRLEMVTTCTARWSASSSSCTTSRRSTWRRRPSSASRRWCAGGTPSAAWSRRGLHPAGRGDRPDHRAGQVGAAGRLPQGQRWRTTFPSAVALTMSVNLSGRQLLQPGLVAEVAAAITDSGFDPSCLVLEITETVFMDDTASTLEVLQALKALGVRLAIDDFGTGYSSLTYLQRFPVDVLKIDKSFIDGLGSDNAEESAVARTIVSLAKALKLETVAEGVERTAHVRELEMLECDIAQGFFFARPLDVTTLELLMAAGGAEFRAAAAMAGARAELVPTPTPSDADGARDLRARPARRPARAARRGGTVTAADRAGEAPALPGSAGEHRLQEQHGTSTRAKSFYDHQVLDHLNTHMRAFVGRMEMVFVATSDAHGEADCSFRAGPPGFVAVLDHRTLAYPEYRGNGVMASLGNLTENGHVGLLFLDLCGDAIGLHVNGRASVVENDVLAARRLPRAARAALEETGGRHPERWVVVDVVEAYIHCSKHIPQLVKRRRRSATGAPTTSRRRAATTSGSARPAGTPRWPPQRCSGRPTPAQGADGPGAAVTTG